MKQNAFRYKEWLLVNSEVISKNSQPWWPRMIVLVDMNSFFASMYPAILMAVGNVSLEL